MVTSTRGHGHGRGRGRSSGGERGTRKCDHCGRINYTSDRCWDKFGRPEKAQNVIIDTAEGKLADTVEEKSAAFCFYYCSSFTS